MMPTAEEFQQRMIRRKQEAMTKFAVRSARWTAEEAVYILIELLDTSPEQ